MKGLNLNHKMLKEYVSELLEAKLLKVDSEETSKFVVTPKGEEYLKKFRELQKIADFSA
jgi:predicted transcriptional regulator